MLVKRLRKEPTVQDFLSPEKFANVICKNNGPPDINRPFNGSLTVPIYTSCQKFTVQKEQHVFNILGLQK